MKKIFIQNKVISTEISQSGYDYISLTDMAKFKNADSTGIIIANWLTTKYSIQFMGAWEILHNPNFNVMEFHNIRNEAGTNGYILSSSTWIKKTGAIGIKSSVGRYGGTFAHKDIAFEFATWLSPEFKLYLIKEFQRLKNEENKKLTLGWDAKRILTKINYKIHTDAVKNNIIIPNKLSKREANITYASEADVLNKALFGVTAEQWRRKNRDKDGNLRDYANVYQLVCLANLETLNSEFIKMEMSQLERLIKLNDIAISQMKSLQSCNTLKKLK